MSKLTLADLKKIRDEKNKEMTRRDADKEIQVVVGMGTCGIASGAKETFSAFIDELDKSHVNDVVVKQTGCMGFCSVEPTVRVIAPEMPDTIYNKVSAEVARRIVKEHIIGRKLVDDHVFDHPSRDILTQ
ncbi:MAG: (2Fe-2S) ferredoxin domain-containing protein [Chitinivibrionia bacterium]|jgi:NADP-reducing hydrogenase subunit HndB|nr:(2Fe-2S) ferredoxin domain-containing protein [Chitinivibrionia bacterium]